MLLFSPSILQPTRVLFLDILQVTPKKRTQKRPNKPPTKTTDRTKLHGSLKPPFTFPLAAHDTHSLQIIPSRNLCADLRFSPSSPITPRQSSKLLHSVWLMNQQHWGLRVCSDPGVRVCSLTRLSRWSVWPVTFEKSYSKLSSSSLSGPVTC